MPLSRSQCATDGCEFDAGHETEHPCGSRLGGELTRTKPGDQIAVFEIHLRALDKPTERRRWNGGPLASKEANEALNAIVEAAESSLRDLGFELVRSSYGVHAYVEEIPF